MKHLHLGAPRRGFPSPRRFPTLGLIAVAAVGAALWPAGHARVEAQAPPPPPTLAPTSVASPQPSELEPTASPAATETETPTPRHGRRHHAESTPNPDDSSNPGPTSTPTSPAFATLDGTWEVQLQYPDRTEYSYLVVAQKDGGALDGVWRIGSKEYPFEGTYDGRLIRMLVKMPQGDVTMSGYVEGGSDMVGIVDLTNGHTAATAFTAEHRPSKKGSVFKKGIY